MAFGTRYLDFIVLVEFDRRPVAAESLICRGGTRKRGFEIVILVLSIRFIRLGTGHNIARSVDKLFLDQFPSIRLLERTAQLVKGTEHHPTR